MGSSIARGGGADAQPHTDSEQMVGRSRPDGQVSHDVDRKTRNAGAAPIPRSGLVQRTLCCGAHISRFCDLLRGFERRLTPVMRQHQGAGEKAFVDYSGKRIGIADPTTGEIREAEIFVGVLGASNLTYAEATWTQTLPDWTGAHVRMFRFFGGAPKLLVPDNLKSGINKASF